jgi:hypothetical protein
MLREGWLCLHDGTFEAIDSSLLLFVDRSFLRADHRIDGDDLAAAMSSSIAKMPRGLWEIFFVEASQNS